MRSRPSALRAGAVVFAVALAGSYVWFKAAQARGGEGARALPGSKGGIVHVSDPAATQPTTQDVAVPVTLLPGSKSTAVFVPAATQPSTTPSPEQFRVIFGSKSAPVDLIPTTASAAQPSR